MKLARLTVIQARLAAQTGWRRNLIAFLAGAASILAFAPFHASCILFFTLPVLLWLTDPFSMHAQHRADEGRLSGCAITLKPVFSTGRAKLGFAVGWWFGFGFHLAGLYWIGGAFLVQYEVFAWLIPFAIMLLPAGLAVFHGVAIAVLACLSGSTTARVLGLMLALSATEWLRGTVLTGFPWNILGYALAYPLVLLQTAGLVGIYGMTLIALGLFSAPLPALAEAMWQRRPNAALVPIIAFTLAPLTAMLMYGGYVLLQPEPGKFKDVNLRLVQPSIKQRDKFDPSKRAEIFARHLELSRQGLSELEAEGEGITHIIWPEAALAFLALRSPEVLAGIANALPDNVTLIAGTLRLEGELAADARRYKVFNSAMVVGGDGRVIDIYDKVHLVPFGEYLPLQDWLEAVGLEQLTRVRGGFAVGADQQHLTIPGLAETRILICYEVIFPGEVVPGSQRPSVLINITNDAWYGYTSGPFQHFHQSVVRAVEQGVPLIRVGNNGISGVVSPRGRVLEKLNLDDTGVIDTPLPKPIAPTLYSRLGEWVFVAFWLMLFVTMAVRAGFNRKLCDIKTVNKAMSLHRQCTKIVLHFATLTYK